MKKIRIKNIKISEGMYNKFIQFSNQDNLITSDGQNSTGKTTLVRFLLYGMGYPIPSTKGIIFGKCTTVINLQVDDEEIEMVRNHNSISVKKASEERFYSLPFNIRKVHKEVFGELNDNVIDNLLGTYYIDQDRGWTLLNRGVVISDIRFNIERFIRGLSDQDTSALEIKLTSINEELLKYKQMLNVGEYQEQMLKNQTKLITDDYNTNAEIKLINQNAQKQKLENDLKAVESVISKNTKFKKFIEEMNLIVTTSDGEIIPVTEETLTGFSDNNDIHRTRAKMIAYQISQVEKEIEEIQNQTLKEKSQNENLEDNLFNNEIKEKTLIENFDDRILRLPINTRQVRRVLAKLDKERIEVEKLIVESTKKNKELIHFLNKYITLYATEFNVNHHLGENALFTKTLKGFSGAIYHKLVFAFRLAYIKAVEEYVGLNLPIIIDSPTGRELNQENISSTLFALRRDFSNHQIIIATINKLDEFPNAQEIIINSRVLTEVEE